MKTLKSSYLLALLCAPLTLGVGCTVTVSESDPDGGSSLFDPDPEEETDTDDSDTETDTDETDTESSDTEETDTEDTSETDTEGGDEPDGGETTGEEEPADAGMMMMEPITDGGSEMMTTEDGGSAMSPDSGGEMMSMGPTEDQCTEAAAAADEGSCEQCSYQLCCEERFACDNDAECPEAWGVFTACILERNPEDDPSVMPMEDLADCLYMTIEPLEDPVATEDLANCAATAYDPAEHGDADRVEGDGLCSLSCFNIFSVTE